MNTDDLRRRFGSAVWPLVETFHATGRGGYDRAAADIKVMGSACCEPWRIEREKLQPPRLYGVQACQPPNQPAQMVNGGVMDRQFWWHSGTACAFPRHVAAGRRGIAP